MTQNQKPPLAAGVNKTDVQPYKIQACLSSPSAKRASAKKDKVANTATPSTRHPFNTVIGDWLLSAWQIGASRTWVQTRSPEFARKLSRRRDSRLVVRGVAGGFLRTFEFRHGLTWAMQLMHRYTQSEMVTNTPLNTLASS
jgi:hypothetical protein